MEGGGQGVETSPATAGPQVDVILDTDALIREKLLEYYREDCTRLAEWRWDASQRIDCEGAAHAGTDVTPVLAAI